MVRITDHIPTTLREIAETEQYHDGDVCRAFLPRAVGMENDLRIEHWSTGVAKCEDPLTLSLSPKMGERGLLLPPLPLGEGWGEGLPDNRCRTNFRSTRR